MVRGKEIEGIKGRIKMLSVEVYIKEV